jgi:hypothetical protein
MGGSRVQVEAARRYCSRCSPGLFRRINRVTLMERTLFTWLGFFPWECVSCRRRRFFRDSGKKRNAPATA